MGYQHDLNIVRNCRKSLLHLTMLTSIVTAAALTTSVAGQQDPLLLDKHRPAIAFCDDKTERTVGRRLLYITTLDGRLSALDITKGGKVRWSVPTGPGPLISSSIHRLELTNNGQFVRMIPSLSGGIYKFDGESIDPIPITTENLLSSSTRFSDDLVISGGKETRTYGVCARTGQLLYECSMNGCVNATQAVDAATSPADAGDRTTSNEGGYRFEHDPLLDDVILLRRQTQTVRAVESRTGVERWNFSVGQHELDVIKSSECHGRQFSELDMAILDLEVKVIVPEGLIYAFSKSEPNVLLWKYKFDHPIVSGWKTGPSDELESIDLFGSAQWVWDQEDNMFDPPFPSTSPSIYLGMYDKQLYIQESVNLRKEIVDQSNLYTQLTAIESTLPKIPWRPIAASSNSLMIFHDDKVIAGGALPPHHIEAPNTGIQGNELVPYDEDNFALAAQSVLNASEYVNGNGFYLYTDEDLNRSAEEALCGKQEELPAIEVGQNVDNITNHTLTDDLGFSLDDIDAPVKVVILSLWFWWKEIVVIAFTSAVLLNLFIGQRHHTEREIVVIERHIPVPTAMEATESSTAALLGPTTNSFSKSNNNGLTNGHRTLSESTSHSGGEIFSSRFQGDFDLVRCLGRGGFGVVFEAKNKLDDCKYAVKRITLPNKKESQRRVMREVKTLANCEHQNIVRFFQAWVESPPPGWQEEEDGKLLAHEMSTSIQIETPDGTTLPSFASSSATANPPKRRMPMDKKRQLMSWVESTAYSSDQGEHNGLAEVEEDDEDDSCIVFRTESQSLAMKDEPEEDSCESKKNVVSHRKSQYDAISIDIQSRSDKSQNGKSIDFSQLSDSFQIEFVRSANGENGYDFGEDDELPTHNASCPTSVVKKRPLSLDLTNNNNCKALIEVSAAPPKPRPNKVYLYIQMQLCRKESLRDWLRDNRTEAREAHIGSIFHQIVDAVDYVHVKGLIHRDLKPSNIFFSQDGQIKIGDFGLVTDMCETPELDANGDEVNGNGAPTYGPHTQKVGTTLYMSPEQRLGKHYDCKVDIYSLGVIFFELLVYFSTEMERMTTLRNLRNDLYPKEFPADYPAEYELLQQMLSNLPEGRPSTSELKWKLSGILKMPEGMGDGEDALARRFSRSRTFSSSE